MNTLEEKKDTVNSDRYRGVSGKISRLSKVQIYELSLTLTKSSPSKSIINFIKVNKRVIFITTK
jgi:hypothetical protein